ncbi:MAG: enoyl-CoA hydratase-related protein [Gammaproteobacteria bacterium]
MQFSACNYEIKNSVATITLNRPDKGNAMNEQMINELRQIISSIADDVYVLCIKGAGKHFCTGADLQEMQQGQNDPSKLALLMKALSDLNIPIVAALQGAVFAGAMGLIANSDIVIAEESAIFCLSEVKLGLIPAIISPYLIEAIGVRAAKRIMLSAERISTHEAQRIGLIHHVTPVGTLNDTLAEVINNLLANEPHALRAVKELCRDVITLNPNDRVKFTAELLDQIRKTDAAQARLNAFFENKHV